MKAATLSGVIVLLAFIFWRGVKPAWNEVSSDFSNYYTAAHLVYANDTMDSLYNDASFRTAGVLSGAPATVKFTPFPPITTFVALPLSWMGPLYAHRTLLVINLALMFFCIRLIQRISGWAFFACTLFLLVTGWGLINNLRLGQLYMIVLWLTLLGHVWAVEKKQPYAGASLGLLATVKYFNVVYLPAYWISGKRRLTLACVTTILLLFFFQLLYFGVDVMSNYLQAVLLPHLDGRIGGQGTFHFHFQSWESFLSFLFVTDPDYNPDPWLDIPVAKTVVKYALILLVIAGAVVGFRRIGSFPETWKMNGYIGLSGAAAFALLPASATYHFLMLSFPVLLLVLIPGLDRTMKWIILSLYACIGLIPYGMFEYLGNNWGVFFGFPRLWAVTILFVVVLMSILRMQPKE